MRLHEIEAGQKVDKTYIKPDPDMDKELVASNPNFRFKDIIEVNCSDALSEMRKAQRALYRGFHTSSSDAFHGRSRDNRITYSSEAVVNHFNQACAAAGFKTNRTNSISCTSNPHNAGGFGDLFYLFPLNGFHFLWSKQIDDFGSVFMEAGTPEELDAMYNIDEREETWVDAFQYHTDNFVGALESGHEISIHGEYYAIKVETPIFGKEVTTLARYLGIR